MSLHLMADRVKKLACPSCGLSIDPAKHQPLAMTRCPGCKKAVRVPAAFDQYELTQMLGKGTSGSVFKAFNPVLRRHVALKILADHDAGASLAEACLVEARALAQLNHPNVVQVYTIGCHRGQHYIAMELVEGGTAEQYLKAGRQLTEVDALNFAICVARGLDAALEQGMLHMDVKPGNILIAEDTQEPKLIDFGAAQFVATLPAEAKFIGTPYYVAPEVVRGKKPDFKADLYSLGATLFHLFTGRPPFEGTSTSEVVKARLKAQAPSMLSKCNHVHAETSEVVGWMLERDPDRRYGSYGELIEAFENLRDIVEEDALERSDTFWSDDLLDDDASSQVISTALGDGAASSSLRKNGNTKTQSGFSGGVMAAAVLGLAALVSLGVIVASQSASNDPAEVAVSDKNPPTSDSPEPRPNPRVRPTNVEPPSPVTPLPSVDIIPTPKSTPMLVAFWPFESDAKQASEVPLEVQVRGRLHEANDGIASAQRFAGRAYLESSGPAQVAGNSSFTLSMRIMPDALAKRCGVFEFGRNKARGGFGLTLESHKTALFQIAGGPGLEIPLNLKPGKASHLAVLFDQSNAMLVAFVNGQQVKQASVKQPLNMDPTGGIRIGRSSNSDLSGYVGTLADVRFYNHALAIARIHRLAAGALDLPVSQKPVALWTMINGATDSSGNGLKTEAVGPPKFTLRDGAGQMDNRSGEGFIRADLPVQMAGSRSFTLSIQFTPAKQDTSAWLLDWGDRNKLNRGFGMQMEPNGTARIGFSGAGGFCRLDLSPYFDREVRLIVVGDSADKRLSAYVDGVEKVTTGLSDSYAIDVDKGLRIGGGGGQVGFKGLVGEVRLYDRPIDSHEIQRLSAAKQALLSGVSSAVLDAKAPKGPIHRWTFDQGAADVVGHIDTKLVGDAKIVEDAQRGKVLELSGKNSYAKLGKGFKDFSKGITLAAWVRPTRQKNNARIFALSNQRWLQNISFGLGSSGGTGLAIYKDVSTARNPSPHAVGASQACKLNEWQHVAATVDSSRNAVLYRNGQPVGRKQLPIMPVAKTRTWNFIGISSWAIVYKDLEGYEGRLDDLALFNRDLSAKEIADLHRPQSHVVVAAKSARLQGAKLRRERSHFNGDGYIGFDSDAGGSATWQVDASVGGQYEMVVRYAAGSEKKATPSLGLEINGKPAKAPIGFASHGNGPQAWMTLSMPIELAPGKNTFVFRVQAGQGAPDLDQFALRLLKPNRTAPSVPDVAVKPSKSGPTNLAVATLLDKQFVGLIPESATAKSGAKLSIQKQGTMWVEGGAKSGDVYTVSFKVPADRISALRLIAIPSSSLPAGGPGLGPGGSFRLNELAISAGPMDGDLKPVAIQGATDDTLISYLNPKFVYDGKPVTAWGLSGRAGSKRVLTVRLAQPIENKGGSRITLTMDQKIPMSRFRVSATASDDPKILVTAKYVAPPTTYKKYLRFGGGADFVYYGRKWASAPTYVAGGFGVVGGETQLGGANITGRLMKVSQEKLKAVRFTVPSGNKFKVTMLFSENRHSGPDRRLFDVLLEGKVITKSLDIFKMAKGMGKFYRIEQEVAVEDGVLDVVFKKVKDQAVLTAITVESIGKLNWADAGNEPAAILTRTKAVPAPRTGSGQKVPIIQPNAAWAYLAGSDPKDASWTSVDFEDQAWPRGPAGFGYGDDDDRTVLNMRGKFTRVYIRAAFDGQQVLDAAELGLMINYDDGFVAYLNGKEMARSQVGNGSGPQASKIGDHEARKHEYFMFQDFKAHIRPGLNVIAIEGHNRNATSSDFSLDPYLVKQ
jgi:serine/threonine protein kinase